MSPASIPQPTQWDPRWHTAVGDVNQNIGRCFINRREEVFAEISNTSNSSLLNGLISHAGRHTIIFFIPQGQTQNAPPINSNRTKRQSRIKNILPMKKGFTTVHVIHGRAAVVTIQVFLDLFKISVWGKSALPGLADSGTCSLL
mmetsp:Transcript_43730/g.51207  ORF Transcript_43730/g.51207 Transcript_43730/m.51207 type:complete len:144 (+) Transcript_43730:684-1115(+)